MNSRVLILIRRFCSTTCLVLVFVGSGLNPVAQNIVDDSIKSFNPNPCHYVERNHFISGFPFAVRERGIGWIEVPEKSDEFNTFNPGKWVRKGMLCHAMSPDAFFTNQAENAYVEGGRLKMRVTPSESYTCAYTDENGQVVTKNYLYQSGWIESVTAYHYGYFEMRCKLPVEPALFPCFWLVGGMWNAGMMTDYDEIDVFERSLSYQTQNNLVLQNFYHDTGINPTWHKLTQKVTLDQAFTGTDYLFAVEWLPEEIVFYINGVATTCIRHTDNPALYRNSNCSSHFTCTDINYAIPQKVQISLSLQTNGNTPPLLNFPFEIDFFRSYKLAQSEIPGEFAPTSFSMSDPEMFRVHSGVRLGGNAQPFTIPSNGISNIMFWGVDYITLGTGFTLMPGTEFCARTIKTHPDLYQTSSSQE